MPKVSVILPVYNVEKYLPRCLDSILAQSFADFELLAVDDKSSDNSVNIVREYAKNDNRIQLILKEHSGLGNTRNCGIEASSGEYLMFVDSDDAIAPHAIKTLVTAAECQNSDMVFFNFSREIFSENGPAEKTDAYLPYDGAVNSGQTAEAAYRALIGFEADNPFRSVPMLGSAWRRFTRRSLFTENGIRFADEREIMLEDLPTSIRLHRAADRITFLSEPLYCYRYNPKSLTTSYREHKFDMLKRCFDNVSDHLRSHDEYDAYNSLHCAWFIRFAVHESIVNLFSKTRIVSFKQRYREVSGILEDDYTAKAADIKYFKSFSRKDRLIARIIIRFPVPLVYLFYRIYSNCL